MVVSNVELRVDGRNAVNQLNRVNRAANTLQGTVGKLAGTFAGIQAAKFVFFKTAELETQTRSLKVLTGSLGNAQKIIKELQQFGAVTPFTSTELIETAKRLKAFGFETERVVDITKRLGDIAGATGADLGGIATAFGQIQAKGRLQGEELLQLQERGVDLQGTLRKEYGLTAEEFQKALSQGRIGADAVTFALEKLTEEGGKYAEGAFAQSDTLSGKLSTLQDNIDNLARTLGNVLSPAIKGILDQAIGSLNALNQLLAIGARAQDFGMTPQQRVKILRQAEEEAKEIALIRGGGKLDPAVFNQIKMQREKDLIEMYGFETGQLQLPTEAKTLQIQRPELGLGTVLSGGKSGKTAEERAADALKQQREQAAALLLSKKQEALLTGDITEQQRASLEHVIEKMNLRRQFPQLGEDELQVLRDQLDVNFGLSQADKDRIEQAKELKKAQDAEKKRIEDLNQKYQQIGDTISSGVVDALRGAVRGTKSLAEVATDMLNNIIDQMLQLAVNMALFGNATGTFSGGSGILGNIFGGARANGGTVTGGRSYVVGERGPELFTPGRTGSIAPNSAMGGANIVVNVDASGSSVEGDEQQSRQLGKLIGAAVQSEIVKQKMPGGLLS